jgi:hypothetical protein
MKSTFLSVLIPFLMTVCTMFPLRAGVAPGSSFYTLRPDDAEAVYFTPEHFDITADGKTDVSVELQRAIDQLKKEKNFGIVFIPEGKYRISRTIYIPKAIRLIGYGTNRPVIFLGKNSPGYQEEVADDKGKANYMFWFTSGLVEPGREPRDAGAGTFYSAISNINLEIEDGNPYAVALRTHFAQHSFVSHLDIHTGKGKAGLYDVGNEMEDVRFFGGDYGIYTTKTSPGWPMMMVDTWFEGQRKAAIRSQEGGLTIVRLHAANVPTVIEIEPNYSDKIFMEDCVFSNVSGPALVVSNENNHTNQLSLRNVVCDRVPVLVYYRRSGTQTPGKEGIYRVVSYTHGLHMDDLADDPVTATRVDMEELGNLPEAVKSDIPPLPAMETWVNIKTLGASGDGVTDDTEVFLDAIEKYPNIYIPQGWYVVSEPLKLKSNTCLIGLNPVATQLMLLESTPAFSGFGGPVALLETPEGGKNHVSGIGINTGAYNYRAVGCKWMAGEDSYMNDVKFIGGHGSMTRGPEEPWRGGRDRRISSPDEPVASQGKDLAWDNQYWSLWITRGGGGTFKDIWTASTYSASGIYVSHTSTPGRIYAMSIEHHVRNEARFNGVSNWKVYAFQLEEESREGPDCQPVEMQECSHMVFANLYMFRVIRVNTPYPWSIRTWNCRDIEFLNVHNFAQVKYTTDLPIYDVNTGLEVRPWEFTRLVITGNETRKQPLDLKPGKVEKLATGFEFIEGITRDSKGNIYFCEQRMRRIYKWDAGQNALTLLADLPWEPLSLGCETEDHLLVLFKYNPQPGYKIDGKQERVPQLPDAGGTSFSMWGNSGFATWAYSIDPDDPDETIALLPRVPMGSVKEVVKALYPSNRWRDFHDFNQVSVFVPQHCFVAPDGKTIIPEVYDLARSSSMLEAFPGKPFYASDEYDRRMVRMEVDGEGKLSNLEYFVEQGEFGSAVDQKGNLYVADGDIYIFDSKGNKTGRIEVPERPSAIQFGGREGNTLFITARSSFYCVNLNE